MALNWQPISDFGDKLWELLKGLEAKDLATRLNIHPVWTIGVGFDLIEGKLPVRIGVYRGMRMGGGLLDPSSAADPLTPEAQIEYNFLDRIDAAIKAKNQTLLNTIMVERNAKANVDPAYAAYIEVTNPGPTNPRTTFAFLDDDEEAPAIFVAATIGAQLAFHACHATRP